MQAGDAYSGFTWDLWQQIADDLKLTFDLRKVDTIDELLRLVRSSQVDVAIADLSITADRYQVMDFSQPYFDAGLRIMIDEDRHTGLRTLFRDLGHSGHLRVYAWIAVFIVVGTLVLTVFRRAPARQD